MADDPNANSNRSETEHDENVHMQTAVHEDDASESEHDSQWEDVDENENDEDHQQREHHVRPRYYCHSCHSHGVHCSVREHGSPLCDNCGSEFVELVDIDDGNDDDADDDDDEVEDEEDGQDPMAAHIRNLLRNVLNSQDGGAQGAMQMFQQMAMQAAAAAANDAGQQRQNETNASSQNQAQAEGTEANTNTNRPPHPLQAMLQQVFGPQAQVRFQTFTLDARNESPANVLNTIFGAARANNENNASGGNNTANVLFGDLFGNIFAGGGRNPGQFGDYVTSQAALDRIISQLMEQSAAERQPPRASEEVIASLHAVNVTAKQVEEGLECAVCKDAFTLDNSVIPLHCHHYFHPDCIVQWLRVNGTCPVCRAKVDETSESTSSSTNPDDASSASQQYQDRPPASGVA